MTISGVTVLPNQTIPSSSSAGGLYIYSGIVTFVFKGSGTNSITRDKLTFKVRVQYPGSGGDASEYASCVVSPASIAYDGTVSDALWAVDNAQFGSFSEIDRGSGTANLQVEADLAVKGLNGIILSITVAFSIWF